MIAQLLDEFEIKFQSSPPVGAAIPRARRTSGEPAENFYYVDIPVSVRVVP